MRYASVCSGIEAPTVAWHSLGWRPQWFSEIEKFPSAVLAHHYPGVPNLGDMTKLNNKKEFHEKEIDLLVGGTPCQSFSVAGLRKGLDDPRGNLMLSFLGIAKRKRHKWVLWENVPGVLSSKGGQDFGTFLSALGKIGYGWAYRILDAQYFGVPQRRRRVFVVGYLGDWRPAGAVLFERESLRGDIKKGKKERQKVTRDTSANIDAPEIALPLLGKPNTSFDCETETLVIGTLNASGAGMSRPAGQGNELDFLILEDQGGSSMNVRTDGKTGAMRANQHQHQPIIIEQNTQASFPKKISLRGNSTPNTAIAIRTAQTSSNGHGISEELTHTLGAADRDSFAFKNRVRRLTPRECERLQGFPDDYTLIQFGKNLATDGVRYKAIGNSMAVPVMKWLGQRIQEVDRIANIL